MKKLFLMLGMVCLFMVACNNQPKQEQKNDDANNQSVVENGEHKCPFCTLKAEYAEWDKMTDEQKQALNEKAQKLFAELDDKMKEEGKGCCEKAGEVKEACEKKMGEISEEAMAQCKKMQEAWGDFSNKSLDEQKDLVFGRIAAMGMGESKCGGHEGEGHQCGGDHQCQHETK